VTDLNKSKNVRQLASEILLKVDTQKAYADILLDQSLRSESLNLADRNLLTELIYGTLRWRGKIDAKIAPFLSRPLFKTEPFVRNLLRLTFYQLLFLNKIPDYAAVNEAVDIAKTYRQKSAGFVNGVLRGFLRRNKTHTPVKSTDNSTALIAAEYSHPQWLVERWIGYFGIEEAKALMLACNERAPLVLRVNLPKSTRDDLLELLRTSDLVAIPTRASPLGITVSSGAPVETLPGFAQGHFQVQGEASQLVAYILDPQPGETILDACAAPGGKTTHIAELMEDRGIIIAVDTSARGVERIRENLARLDLHSVHASRADASRDLPAALDLTYDRILVDAPCSGLGTLRSHPEIKWQRGESDIKRLATLQIKLLQRLATHLKPGGILVYSTCTLTADENERVVESFMQQRDRFELEDAARYLPLQAKHMTRGKYFQALPHRDNTDGFFAARMKKVS
jgi:16S rRNA (cytosine967-C5)-methyltransferase